MPFVAGLSCLLILLAHRLFLFPQLGTSTVRTSWFAVSFEHAFEAIQLVCFLLDKLFKQLPDIGSLGLNSILFIIA
jgi:hypothetical protein